jgi:hypothetical protein
MFGTSREHEPRERVHLDDLAPVAPGRTPGTDP